MNKRIAFFIVILVFTVSLSGCLRDGLNNGENDNNMGSPDEVNGEDYNVLYAHRRVLEPLTIH